ncbi:MFS transporter [Acinetobacter sp. NCu2D-2]|uniref:MFS transporter n=1 Tax=Acinetobacter sp. NCu2D-2 TaxID=1608473 RepID=UPI0007CDA4D5|nr:MFS transporter [Acinetobacter sp. NCu2D-2]ANF81294.1 MFS transporter [Acinetobacter sp. NCu2D-2]
MQNIYLLLFSLYWAQGLPVGFMTHALPVILRAEGVSLTHIGGFGLLMLPWSIKVFWAPLVDRYGLRSLGHYRSWIIPTQLLTVGVLILLSFMPIHSLDQPLYLLLFFISLLLMNSVGATQDIATDGLAVKMLKGEQQQWGNTFQVVGSRLGFIVGGGAVLWLLDLLQWQQTFLCLALLVALNTIPIFFFKEASLKQNQLKQVQPSFHLKSYFQYFLNNTDIRRWFVVLLTFKIADGLSGPLLKPLMIDLGLSFSQIGVYVTMLGAGAALIGAGLAGLLLKYISRRKTLIIFSLIKILSLAAYWWLSMQYLAQKNVNERVIYIINAAEDMASAMLLVVMLTLIMQYSRKAFAATDFTFQVAIMATVSGGLYTLSGIVADQLGYMTYMAIIVAIAILCLIPILRWKNQSQA